MVPKKSQNSDSYIESSKKLTIKLASSLISKIQNKRDQLILQLFLQTDIKINELIELQLKNIQQNKALLPLRTISIPKELCVELKAFGDRGKPFLFSSLQRPILSKRNIHSIFEKYSKYFGLDLSVNSFKRLKKQPIKKTIISEIDLNKIISKSNLRDQKIILTILETGCTVKELVELKSENVTDKGIQFNNRVSNISLQLSSLLNEGITGREGSLTEQRVFQILKIYGITAKQLRYTCIANSFSKGLSKEEISSQTGIRHLKYSLFGSLE